jgi:hypothetical protein
MLENSGAALDRLFSSPAPRHAAPGHGTPRYSGPERGTPRRPRDQRGQERADAKNTNMEPGRARRGEATPAGPGYGAAGRGAPARAGAGREKGAARGGRAGRDARADTGYRAPDAGYRAPDAGRRHRDTTRLDVYGPPRDWDLDDRGDPDYDGDPDDDADADLDAAYDVEPGDDADADYDAEPGDDADADYDAEADYDADADDGPESEYEADADYDGTAVYRLETARPRGDGGRRRGAGYPGAESGHRGADTRHHRGGGGYRGAAVFLAEGPPGHGAGVAGADEDRFGASSGPGEPDERTEVLINLGRHNARPKGTRRLLGHWRAIGVAIVGVVVGAFSLALLLPGNDATWPSSVALVQKEIDVACENPNVVSEPSQVNFACGKDTRQILWVFSLLTSGDNPGYSDASNGRKGLEPITPAQGGDIAWSLNLHHPYSPANPTDSLAVAARALNNIIGGATLTGSNGSAVVQPGLESTAANCTRYTGSSALVTRQGFPSVCAQPVTSPAGQAALVNDVFKQWMVGSPASLAAQAGVLFENADNPGNAQVQAILNSLPQTGL